MSEKVDLDELRKHFARWPQVAPLIAEVERLRDTLLFYADPKHYSYPTSPGGWTAYCGIVPADGGQKARAALAEQGEGGE